MRRQLFVVLLLLTVSTSIVAQQTIWKKDHVYAGPGGPEIETTSASLDLRQTTSSSMYFIVVTVDGLL